MKASLFKKIYADMNAASIALLGCNDKKILLHRSRRAGKTTALCRHILANLPKDKNKRVVVFLKFSSMADTFFNTLLDCIKECNGGYDLSRVTRNPLMVCVDGCYISIDPLDKNKDVGNILRGYDIDAVYFDEIDLIGEDVYEDIKKYYPVNWLTRTVASSTNTERSWRSYVMDNGYPTQV